MQILINNSNERQKSNYDKKNHNYEKFNAEIKKVEIMRY